MKEEYELAKKEGRQPICIYCGKPLDEIRQMQYEFIVWRWDKDKKCYIKDDDSGDTDRPFCASCEAEDWDFVDENLVSY